MVIVQHRRLDKFRLLLRRYLSPLGHQQFTETFIEAQNLVQMGEIDKKKESYQTIFWKNYTGTEEGTGLSIVFFSVKKNPAISIEFVPRKLSPDDWADAKALLLVLGLGLDDVWKKFKVSSVEIAVDVRLPFEECVFLAPGVRTSKTTYVAKGTLYLGSKTGRRRFRLYDKGNQLKQVHGGTEIGYPLTRIEVVHQGLSVQLGELHSLETPFGRLLAVPRAKLETLPKNHPQDFELAYFCQRVAHGCPGHDAYFELERPARKRVATILRPLSLGLNGKEGAWKAWISQQENELKTQFLG